MADTRRTYPPRFDSSIPYAAQYNLDELSVYAEAPVGTYFNIGSLPEILTLGKHYFTISYFDPEDTNLRLKTSSQVLFEFKDKRGNIIFSDIPIALPQSHWLI